MEGGSVSNTANIKGNAMLFAGNFGSSVVVGGDAEIGSCSTPGVYLQFPYWRNGRTECDGKGASDVSNTDINAAFTNFSASSMAFSTTPTCTITSTAKKSVQNIEDEEDLSIYPNPAGDNFSISFMQTEQQKVTILLFDVNGRKIDVITDKIYDIGRIIVPYDSTHLTQGVYIIQIQNGSTIITKSLIKE